jgi:hypothetical protein
MLVLGKGVCQERRQQKMGTSFNNFLYEPAEDTHAFVFFFYLQAKP